MKEKTKLYCGPILFDFGWELCFFNPVARNYYNKLKPEHTIVHAPATSRYLYEFADEFISIDVSTEATREYCGDCLKDWSPDSIGSDYHRFGWNDGMLGDWPRIERRLQGRPVEHYTEHHLEKRNHPRAWRDLGPSPEKRKHVADILFSFPSPKPREAHNKGVLRCYPQDYADRLVGEFRELGYSSFACYGGPSNLHVSGTMNLVGEPLEVQCGALAAATLAMGPSGAPLHLASLCRCPVFTWYNHSYKRSKKITEHRYKQYWNPFETPTRHLSRSPLRGHPSPIDMARRAHKWMEADFENWRPAYDPS